MFLSRRDIAVLATAGFMALGTGVIGGEPAKEKPAKSAVIRDGYETGPPTWQREYTDATMRLIAHERSDQAARSGRLSERFLFESGPGSKFFVSQVLPNIPVSEDLGLSLYVRSNQAGAQLFAWVVLPADIDPDTRVPSYVLVPGTIFNRPDRWEKLELVEMLPAIEEQARLLRASTRRQVPLQGAYIARVVVNLMGGQGQSDVFLDDLQVGPVSPETLAAWEAGRSQTGPELAGVAGNSARKVARKGRGEDDSSLPPIKFTRGVLEKLRGEREYAPWFPMAIDAPGANPLELRRRGFDVLVTDDRPDPKAVGPAVERGMLLLPRLSGATEDDGIERVLAAMAAYPFPGSVLLWSIGEHLGSQRDIAARMKEVDHVRGVVAAIHESDEELHLATARVDGEFRLYSRTPAGLDVIGLDLPIWGTSVPPIEGLHYLNQRRTLTARSNPEALFWGWVPAKIPDGVIRNVWGGDEVPSWGRPPVQPEQVRIMTYMALAGGCRGLSFVGDADLTGPVGEALLIEMNFLNAEIDLLEDIIARNIDAIAEYPVLDPDPAERPTTANVNMKRMPLVKEQAGKPGLHAASIRLKDGKGFLILVADLAFHSQWQPPQMAYHDLVVSARLAPGSAVPGDQPRRCAVPRTEG